MTGDIYRPQWAIMLNPWSEDEEEEEVEDDDDEEMIQRR